MRKVNVERKNELRKKYILFQYGFDIFDLFFFYIYMRKVNNWKKK